MRGVALQISALTLSGLLLAGCWNDPSWHQKLTVEVETPDGVVSGSSVGRVAKGHDSFVPGHPGGLGTSSFRGEVTAVLVQPGKYLFALISGADHLAQKVFAPELGLDRRPVDMPDLETWAEQLSQMRTSKNVPPNLYPLLVTFTDINDPKTVKEVDPNNLAATFGPGYALKSITLEITDEPVTSGKVEAVLGWLGPLEGGYLHGGFTSRDSPLGLSGLDFERN